MFLSFLITNTCLCASSPDVRAASLFLWLRTEAPYRGHCVLFWQLRVQAAVQPEVPLQWADAGPQYVCCCYSEEDQRVQITASRTGEKKHAGSKPADPKVGSKMQHFDHWLACSSLDDYLLQPFCCRFTAVFGIVILLYDKKFVQALAVGETASHLTFKYFSTEFIDFFQLHNFCSCKTKAKSSPSTAMLDKW